MQKELSSGSPCPCGSGLIFSDCCEPYIQGETLPTTPEKLMRSRYSAFVVKDFEYLFETTDPQTRNMFDHKANELWAEAAEFLELKILSHDEEGTKGRVEFQARFKENGVEQLHHEQSRFRKSKNQWYFRDGKPVKSNT